jgi:hypothetical protein
VVNRRVYYDVSTTANINFTQGGVRALLRVNEFQFADEGSIASGT